MVSHFRDRHSVHATELLSISREKYVCVEPGMATYWYDLAPNERWIGQQTLETL